VTWTGGCSNGVIEGQGTLSWTWTGGAQQTIGSFSNGRTNGFITTTTSENAYKSVYKGMSINGKHEGKGILSFSNGAEYDGNWRQGKFDGVGRMSYANKAVYSGSWQGGMRDGYGVYTYPDGKAHYDGNWSG